MISTYLKVRVPGLVMAAAVAWSLGAAWLSAHRVITVLAELASYWLLLLAVAGSWYMARRGKTNAPKSFLSDPRVAVAGVVTVLLAWGFSDVAFFHWKLRAIPPTAWAEMVSDVRKIASPTPEGGAMSSSKAPPKSVQQLGLRDDYSGMNAWVDNSPGYPGVRGDVLFGYKSRAWGLWLGQEESLERSFPGCQRRPVAPNALFFVGPR